MQNSNILDDSGFEQEYDNISLTNILYYKNLVYWTRLFSTCGLIAVGLIGLIVIAVSLKLPLQGIFLIYFLIGIAILAAWIFLMISIKRYAAELEKYTQQKRAAYLQNALKWKKWIFIGFSVINSIAVLSVLRLFL